MLKYTGLVSFKLYKFSYINVLKKKKSKSLILSKYKTVYKVFILLLFLLQTLLNLIYNLQNNYIYIFSLI